MISKPAPGIRRRWNTLLLGLIIIFGVITSLGAITLFLEDHYEPQKKELANLKMKIPFLERENSEVQLLAENYKRIGELEEKFRGVRGFNFGEIGDNLLGFSVVPLLFIIGVIIFQWVFSWLWFGSRQKSSKLLKL